MTNRGANDEFLSNFIFDVFLFDAGIAAVLPVKVWD